MSGGGPAPVALEDLPDRDADGYVDLRAYAAIGNGRTIALVAHDGSIDWYPLPDMDSMPPFARLLDAEDGGYLSLAPDDPHEVSRRYLPDTNVLQTEYRTAGGRVRVTDAVNMGTTGRLPWGELARRIEGLEGEVAMSWCVSPGTRLGTAAPWAEQTDNGAVLRLAQLTMAVCTADAGDVAVEDRHVTGRFVATRGSEHLVALVSSHGEPLRMPGPDFIRADVERSVAHWRRWCEQFTYEGPWREAVLRSALTLKLLSHSPSGAMAAAATTSLPESATTAKNWDYRLSWLRDSTYSLHNLVRLGEFEDVHANVSWILRIAREQGPDVPVLSALDGTEPYDTKAYDVPGWRGHGPVVSGNQARDQLQLGVYGDVLNIVQLYVDDGNVLDIATARMVADVADRTCDIWRQPDAGMWELEESRHYTSSKMGCWLALDCAVRMAREGHVSGDDGRWERERDRIHAWVQEECWSEERGAYVWYPGADGLDASVLLHAGSGFDRGPRMHATVDAVRGELGRGPLLYRFSGAEREEKTFVACAFWVVDALACLDRRDEATALMEELLPLTNDVGLLSEMIDADDGAFWGNLPQALSHLALLRAALTLVDTAPAE
ncbi:glycoside hydrolase family 15 protein [Patulibacter sp. SYSU D01012]|uniref:glycoside hydrolase family 15 protein n=1 Tax=Patulibacter sp. SYSU D01012 TaxID=2817381 RepID=UPI001B310F99